jgi:chemotaxis family two-component system response regulator Rcp1
VTGTSKPVQILLVEDSPGDVSLTREAMLSARVTNELHVVGDGEEALSFLRRGSGFEHCERPDLVLLDLNLPKKGGREVLQEMKSDHDLKHIPVIVLTTSEDEVDILQSYRLHANAYVTKPIAFSAFLETLQQLEGFWLQVVRLPPQARGACADRGGH